MTGAVVSCRIIRCGVGIVVESWSGADGIGVCISGEHIDAHTIQLQAAVDRDFSSSHPAFTGIHAHKAQPIGIPFVWLFAFIRPPRTKRKFNEISEVLAEHGQI